MEILEVMIENEKIITSKRQKEADDAEQEEFRGDQKKRYSLLNDCKFSKTKLPKLVITKFDCTNFDWFRFWNQFESQINVIYARSHKFSYLKELVIPKVHLLIDSLLPFTSEGYTRAKNILLTKYGKPSEVANAHVTGQTQVQVARTYQNHLLIYSK